MRQLRPHIATEGLFRVSVPNRVLQQLKAKIEIDRLDNNPDPHVLACGLKAWLRELPQGLIPPPFQDQLLVASNDQNEIRRVISTLPELNKATLNLLFELLNSGMTHKPITHILLLISYESYTMNVRRFQVKNSIEN